MLNRKDFFVFINNYLSKTKLNFELDILNNKKEIMASTELFDIREKKALKCNPFKNYGSCEIYNGFYYYLTYLPNVKLYFVVKKKLSYDVNEFYKTIILTLKSFPDIIVPNIKGKMNHNYFYLFDEFKPLNLFFGIGIDYKKLENFPKKFTKETCEFLFHHYLKLNFLCL